MTGINLLVFYLSFLTNSVRELTENRVEKSDVVNNTLSFERKENYSSLLLPSEHLQKSNQSQATEADATGTSIRDQSSISAGVSRTCVILS